MIVDKKKFYTSLGMITVFTVLFVGMFLPIFDGQNILKNVDELYNSISKGSANYIHDVLEENEKYADVVIKAGLEMTAALIDSLLSDLDGVYLIAPPRRPEALASLIGQVATARG